MDLTAQQAPSMEEAMKRFESGEITETDIIQMLNTTQAELERSLHLVRVLSGAVMLRLQTKAKPAQEAQPIQQPTAVNQQVEAPTPKQVSAPTLVKHATAVEEPKPETVADVLKEAGAGISFHGLALALASPESLTNGRGEWVLSIYSERIEPASPDIAAIVKEWPSGIYAGGFQTFLRLGDVAVLWEHRNGAIDYLLYPSHVFSVKDGVVVELAKVTTPATMRAIIADLVTAAQRIIMNNSQAM